MAVKLPGVSTTQGNSGAVSGALSGAAQGFATGGPVGAIIGGIGGAFGGHKSDKADYRRKMANLYRKQGNDLVAAAARRDMIRKFRMQRASAIMGITQDEGGTRSSAPQNALSSLNTQYAGAEGYMQAGIYIQRKIDEYTEGAAKAQAQANEIGAMTQSFLQAGSTMAGAGMFTPKSMPAPSSASGTYSPAFGIPTYGGTPPYVGMPQPGSISQPYSPSFGFPTGP